VNGKNVEDIEKFPYLGATVAEEGGGSKDITKQLQKAHCEFQRLGKGSSQRNMKENQNIPVPIQDLTSTGPGIWL